MRSAQCDRRNRSCRPANPDRECSARPSWRQLTGPLPVLSNCPAGATFSQPSLRKSVASYSSRAETAYFAAQSLSRAMAAIALQLAQHREIGVHCRPDEVLVGQIRDGDEADMGVLAVESAPGQWLVHILEPMSTDEIGVVGNRAQVAGIGGTPLAFAPRAD